MVLYKSFIMMDNRDLELLGKIAEAKGITRSALIRMALKEYILYGVYK